MCIMTICCPYLARGAPWGGKKHHKVFDADSQVPPTSTWLPAKVKREWGAILMGENAHGCTFERPRRLVDSTHERRQGSQRTHSCLRCCMGNYVDPIRVSSC
ncbi:hypothetical protein Naga_100234g6 [Nannochloropsis gaditana]|uniref:Uncharacterized protein n=1 Tax=Nannochloropsis gaditana TaxID=72520 RepID=W7TWT1_9STRA|nr:hypothetical protein Naga_100234g6 [Nannochloropsis gaditana]